MNKEKYIEVLEELQSNIESEIRLTKLALKMSKEDCITSIQYVLECSGIDVDDSDICFSEGE